MRPLPGIRLTVVVDRPTAVYSGMVPGFVAGMTRPGDLVVTLGAGSISGAAGKIVDAIAAKKAVAP